MDKEQIRTEEVKSKLDGVQDCPGYTSKSTVTINDLVESVKPLYWRKCSDQPRIDLMVTLVEARKEKWEEAGEEWPYEDAVVHFLEISTVETLNGENILIHRGLISDEVYNRVFAQVRNQP